jgi:hypothetical protein
LVLGVCVAVLGGPPEHACAGPPLTDPRLVLAASRFVGFTSAQRAWITAVVARAPRPARDALTRVAPYVTFRRGATEELSEGDHITTFVGTSSLRFLVSLGPRTRATRDALAAHMLMHELGHAVDNGLVGEELRASFGVLFSRSPAWAGCFVQPLGSSQRCVPGTEIFAEQFGFYGSRDRRPRTTYGIPPLYRFRRFGALLKRATGGKDTLLELDAAP